MTVQSMPKPAIFERINLRMIVFIAVIGCFIGYPIYQCLRLALTHGIIHHDGYSEVDLKSMVSFEMDPDLGSEADVPADIRKLDGTKVLLEGEMWTPNGAGANVDNFVLVYSISQCCSGTQRKVQHMVTSTVPPGKQVSFYSGRVRVLGTLHIKAEREGGRIQSLFKLDVDSVEEK